MQERIKYLFRKYLNNTTTPEEFEEIFSAIRNGEHDGILEECMNERLTGPYDTAVKKPRYARMLAAAAVLLAFAVTATWFVLREPQRLQVATIVAPAPRTTVTKATQRSEYKYLLLPDSTQVWLNAASTLEFPRAFGTRLREVTLRGEAYFDVKHAEKIPFVIHTGKVSTVVLGTTFNIKAYPDLEKITVSVNRGKVKVKYDDNDVAVLTKGQEVVIGNKDRKVRERTVKTSEASAWHEGNLVYDDYLIADILSDLERIYDVKIDVDNPDVKTLRVSTAFKRAQGAETALDILCRLTDSYLTLKNGIYYLNTSPKTKHDMSST